MTDLRGDDLYCPSCRTVRATWWLADGAECQHCETYIPREKP